MENGHDTHVQAGRAALQQDGCRAWGDTQPRTPGSYPGAEAAAVGLLVDDVTRVGEAVAIGQRTLHSARQSVRMGLGLSFLLKVIASLGVLPAPVGTLCQQAIDVTVILNALRHDKAPTCAARARRKSPCSPNFWCHSTGLRSPKRSCPMPKCWPS